MWIIVLCLLALVVVAPLIGEAARLPMNKSERKIAPGQFAELSQGITHYRWNGPTNGPVVVCIHGLTTPSFVWQPIAEGLAAVGYRVLSYDLYGRGYSDRPFGRQTPDFFIKQLDDLLADQNVSDSVALIGYSMGGAVATAFAAERPDKVHQLILLAPAGMRKVGKGLFASFLRVPLLGVWLMLLIYPIILKRGIKSEENLPTSVPKIGRLQTAELDYRGYLPAIYSSMRGMLAADFKDKHMALHSEGLPVLAVWGAKDDVIPLNAKNRLGAWNEDAVHYVVQNAGHGLPYTHTEEVLEQIVLFLKAST